MSGITSGTGLISGLDTTSIINQLLQLEARPRQLAQSRILQLQAQQAAYLDLNSRIGALKSAAAAFRTNNVFRGATVGSSDAGVLTGTASPGAALGSYSFIVDRTVETRQVITRGFADRNSSAAGVTSITFESERGRLDTDVDLSQLNGGEGVARGSVVVTDSAGNTATIDLSRVATVNEVLEALNSNQSVRISARVDGNKFIVEDAAGGSGTLQIRNGGSYTTATDLGLDNTAVSGVITGDTVYGIGDGTGLAFLNDGNGVRISATVGTSSPDFSLTTRDGATYVVDIGAIYGTGLVQTAAPVANIEQLRERIENQTSGKVSLQVNSAGTGFELVDSSTPTGSDDFTVTDLSGAAVDLGIVGTTSTDTISGTNVLATINSTLASNLAGGDGLASGAFSITARDGSIHTFSVGTTGSVSQILTQIRTSTGGKVTAALNDQGTALVLTDTTGGTGNLIVAGAGATALGVATAPAGVATTTVRGTRQQHRYITDSTTLSSLNGGQGVGTGRFEIRDSTGRTSTIDIGTDSRNLKDVVDEINSRPNLGVAARINDNGDGIILEKDPLAPQGTIALRVRDVSGSVARGLNIAGEAANTTTENFIDGSFERTVEFDVGDTLDDVVQAINDAGAGVTAGVIRDGAGATPFRLKLTATQTGSAGRFTVDAAGADLGLTTIARGRNARVFFGSEDPATAILIDSTTNSIDGLVDGLSLDIQGRSDDPVTLTVTRDNESIESAVDQFVTAFNDLSTRLATVTAYDAETEQRGTLLGDSAASQLRGALFNSVQRRAVGITGDFEFLSQVGVKLGTGNQLTVDRDKLRAAIEQDPAGVADLFAANTREAAPERIEISPGIFVNNTNPAGYSSLGVLEQMVQFADSYINSTTGILSRRGAAVQDQIDFQNTRVTQFTDQLARRREVLERQFAGLEQTLANLQRQQSSLASLNG